MKIGDVVRQNGRLIEMKGRDFPTNLRQLGVVIEIHEDRGWPTEYEKWNKWLGRGVTVLWSSGRIKRMAENALEVVDEKR